MNAPQPRLRVIVCGTTFGQVYLQGIACLPEHFELVGILARGSQHAQSCAARYGVPLYTAVDQLPAQGVDLACVVVRAAVVGGIGTELALALLERGIHVLQEHPLHHDELANCLRAARQANRQYQLNSFYPDVEPVSRFIAAARHVLAQRRAIYLDAACSVHVLYPLIDILGQALGALRPWSFVLQPGAADYAGPFSCISGRIGGVPLTLRVQNQLDPGDPDNHTQLLHRIALGTEGGTLTLSDTHGHVLWHPRMHLERRDDGVLDLLSGHDSLALPVGSIIGAAATHDFGGVFRQLWPQAIGRALLRMHAAVQAGAATPAQHQYALSSCKAWQELGAQLGPTQAISPPTPQPLAVDDIVRALDPVAALA
jgi:thiazolinyl imide reductase